LSAWGGYISENNVWHVNKLLHKTERYRFTDTMLPFPELLRQSDEFYVLCVPITVYVICLKKTILCSKYPCDPEVILLIYLGINTILPGSLLFLEIYK